MSYIFAMRERAWLSVVVIISVSCVSAGPANRLSEELDDYFRGRGGNESFSGTVAVFHNGEPVLVAGYGQADAELAVPNSPETIYRIGSLTKPLVAATVMKLLEDGSLRLSDSICSYLSECPSAWKDVTVQHLLTHSSGIPDRFGDLPAAPVSDQREVVETYIETTGTIELHNEPGEVYAYSNFGYVLLGTIIETSTDRPWVEVMNELVLTPAGMRHTAYDDVWAIVPGRARGYDTRNGSLVNVRYKDHGAFSAGGLYSTAGDLASFQRALLDGSLIADSAVEASWSVFREDYGYGWQVRPSFHKRAVNHTGGIDGFSSHMVVYPDDQLAIVVLSNVESEAAKATACDLASIMFGVDYPRLGTTVSGTVDTEFATAVYRSDDGITREILVSDAKLVYRRDEQDLELRAIDGRRFWRLIAAPEIVFIFEGDGAVADTLRAVRCGEELFRASRGS